MQEYKKDLVGVEEIKKDRDIRIEKLRGELEELFTKFNKVDASHTSMKVNYEHMTDEND